MGMTAVLAMASNMLTWVKGLCALSIKMPPCQGARLNKDGTWRGSPGPGFYPPVRLASGGWIQGS